MGKEKALKNQGSEFREGIRKLGGTIHCIKVCESCFENIPVSAHFTKETYFRLLATDILPGSIDRILYLDPDIIVTKDITAFYNQSFEMNGNEKALIACEDLALSGNTKLYNNLDMTKDARYFNAGVVLMNVKKLRQLKKSDDMFEYIKKRGRDLLYLDQDVLNAFFYDKTIFCEGKYNLQVCNVSANSKKIDDAFILHYAGPHKPWKVGYKHGAKLVYEYYSKKSGMYVCCC